VDALIAVKDFLLWLISLAKPETLREIVNFGGPWWVSYAILFAIIFSETGLLIGFFLPGDSLLFAAGFLSAPDADGKSVFNFWLLNLALIVAAVVGDALNYYLGTQAGTHVFDKGRFKFIRREHLMAAKAFYDRHGGKAIVLARFVPLVRTFTPFVAGVAKMHYPTFAFYNLFGGIFWVFSMTLAGRLLGQIPIIQQNFEKAIIGIIVISVLPVIIEWWRHRRSAHAKVADAEAGPSAAAGEAS
jgi:membrane-associated protein